jgi:hydrogenase expression/formation protein HypC
MCLAVPAKIVECEGSDAVVDLHGNRVAVNTLLVPEAVVGDWVLVHAGFAIQRLDCREAEETWAVLEDLAEATERADRERSGGGEAGGG